LLIKLKTLILARCFVSKHIAFLTCQSLKPGLTQT